ncbi:MFS transporter [Thermodesulfobacteriota bacterium]
MEKRLPSLLGHSYGFANFTFTLMMMLAMQQYTFFMTDIALITAAHLTIITFITHVADGLSVPFSGVIIQKTQSRWGQFRGWLLFIPISTCIFFTATFTNLPIGYNIKMVYLSVVYILAHVSLNFAFNAHLGMISVLSKDTGGRLILSSRNVQWGMASQILYALAIIPMLNYTTTNISGTWGYFYTVGLLAVIQIVGYWALFFQTKEYDKYDPNKKLTPANNLTVPEMIAQVLGNKHLITLSLAECANNLGLFSIQVTAMYYFTKIAGDALWMAPFTLALGIATFASTILGPMVEKFIGKRNVYLVAAAYGSLGYIVLRMYGADSPYIYIGIVCVTVLGHGMSAPIRQAMFMDTAEYGYYKTGKNASAFIMSMLTLPVKIGITFAATLVSWGLDLIHYDPNMEITDQVVNGLMDIICYIPIACGVITFVIMLFYSLTNDKVAKYMEANKIKRGEAENQEGQSVFS